MADLEISQFTANTSPLSTDYVGGYLGAAAGVAGGNRKYSFATIATYVNTVLTSNDIVIANGKAIETDTTTAHTVLFKAYDVDGAAYKTFMTLTNANTPSLAIAAPSGGAVTIDGAVIGGTTPLAATFTTISATDDITVANGKAIKTNTTTANTLILQAYDVDGTAYKTFITLTNGNTPSLSIAAPSGGTVALDGAVIGANAAAAATVTSLTQTGAGANVFNSSALDTDFTVKAITSGNAISYDAGTSALTFASTTIGLTGAITLTGAVSQSGSTTYTTAASTIVLKQGANGKTGTFVANGVTPVTVSNSSITANSGIIFTLKTVGGTVGAYPAIQTITPTTGFTVACTALDTSTYNYHIIESAA